MSQTLQIESSHAAPVTLEGLSDALLAAFPGAVLVPTWVLREIIAHDRPGMAGLLVPRQSTHVIACSRLEQLARRERLPIGEVPRVPWLALLPCPESCWLDSTPAPLVLRQYWRLLFQARVHAEVRQTHSPEVLREHISQLGTAVLHEVRLVLHEERLLPAGADDAELYAAFVAIFMELYYFDRRMLPRFFPLISRPALIAAMVGKRIDADALLRETRLAGSAHLPAVREEPTDGGLVDELAPDVPHGAKRDEPRVAKAPEFVEAAQPVENTRLEPGESTGAEALRKQKALLASAERASGVGNNVRAALLHIRAFHLGGALAGVSRAVGDLDALAERLAATPEIGDAPASAWRQALRPLLGPAARGWWDRQARLLYDLQKVCVDNEREVYKVSLVEWVLDLGRRPLRKPLPRQRLVLLLKHLHSAANSLTRIHLAAPARANLGRLLSEAAHSADCRLHAQLYPVVLAALHAGGLQPGCCAEAVAENKLIEELLDAVARKGFIAMGDLRDAISRNAIKLDDLRGAREFFAGDQLLRINRKLAGELEGVYRPGEVYLRFFQRLSSLFFADNFGRALFWTLVAPFAGALFLLEGLEHTVGLACHLIFDVNLDLGAGFRGPPKNGAPPMGWKVPGLRLYVDHPFRYLMVVAGFFVLVNWPAIRAVVARGLWQGCRGLYWLFVGLPGWVRSLPAVRIIVQTLPLRIGLRYLVKPLAFAGLTSLVSPKSMGIGERFASAGTAFFAANLLLNSRHVRALEGALFHKLRTGLEKLTGSILTGLYRMIMGFFEQVLEDVDRMLYQVDEWLRFRSGQGRKTLVAKALLGVVWFYVEYGVRFVVNLLIEPQLNPIKHFPVVTVSAKMLIPQIKPIKNALEGLGMAHAKARWITASIIAGVPGIFGFLAWELLSNWKLYKANRPPALGKVIVGSHGESLARLLRPGIHSGTIPRTFARLRRAAGRGSGRRVQKQLHALEHAREAVEHFLNRELIVRLFRHPAWHTTPVTLGEVKLSPTSIVAQLHCPALNGGADQAIPLRIGFRCYSGWIVAGIEGVGWAGALSEDPQKAALLSLAIAGLYKLSGVDLVREQVDEVLNRAFCRVVDQGPVNGPDEFTGFPGREAPAPGRLAMPDPLLDAREGKGQPLRWDVRPKSLVVWVDRPRTVELEYELGESILHPRSACCVGGPTPGNPTASLLGELPVLESGELMLCHQSIGWQAWADAWEPAATFEMCRAALGRIRVLPEISAPEFEGANV